MQLNPKAVDLLLEKESFAPDIWECACGEGHLSERLIEHGYKQQFINTALNQS